MATDPKQGAAKSRWAKPKAQAQPKEAESKFVPKPEAAELVPAASPVAETEKAPEDTTSYAAAARRSVAEPATAPAAAPTGPASQVVRQQLFIPFPHDQAQEINRNGKPYNLALRDLAKAYPEDVHFYEHGRDAALIVPDVPMPSFRRVYRESWVTINNRHGERFEHNENENDQSKNSNTGAIGVQASQFAFPSYNNGDRDRRSLGKKYLLLPLGWADPNIFRKIANWVHGFCRYPDAGNNYRRLELTAGNLVEAIRLYITLSNMRMGEAAVQRAHEIMVYFLDQKSPLLNEEALLNFFSLDKAQRSANRLNYDDELVIPLLKLVASLRSQGRITPQAWAPIAQHFEDSRLGWVNRRLAGLEGRSATPRSPRDGQISPNPKSPREGQFSPTYNRQGFGGRYNNSGNRQEQGGISRKKSRPQDLQPPQERQVGGNWRQPSPTSNSLDQKASPGKAQEPTPVASPTVTPHKPTPFATPIASHKPTPAVSPITTPRKATHKDNANEVTVIIPSAQAPVPKTKEEGDDENKGNIPPSGILVLKPRPFKPEPKPEQEEVPEPVRPVITSYAGALRANSELGGVAVLNKPTRKPTGIADVWAWTEPGASLSWSDQMDEVDDGLVNERLGEDIERE